MGVMSVMSWVTYLALFADDPLSGRAVVYLLLVLHQVYGSVGLHRRAPHFPLHLAIQPNSSRARSRGGNIKLVRWSTFKRRASHAIVGWLVFKPEGERRACAFLLFDLSYPSWSFRTIWSGAGGLFGLKRVRSRLG